MAIVKVSSDHAGYELKTEIVEWLNELGHEVFDHGPSTPDRVDYPDYADALCENFEDGQLGILICGSGQGMAMRCNKYPQVRGALCWNEEVAALARGHNNANVLCLGSRVVDSSLNKKIIVTFLSTEFEGGRHQVRSAKISHPLKGE